MTHASLGIRISHFRALLGDLHSPYDPRARSYTALCRLSMRGDEGGEGGGGGAGSATTHELQARRRMAICIRV